MSYHKVTTQNGNYRKELYTNPTEITSGYGSKSDRIIRRNYELTSFHKEVLDNLNSIRGALLRMNRSIQAEGTYGEIKANRGYERFRRRGINKAILDIALISCGFNLHKYHLSRLAKAKPTKAAAE